MVCWLCSPYCNIGAVVEGVVITIEIVFVKIIVLLLLNSLYTDTDANRDGNRKSYT